MLGAMEVLFSGSANATAVRRLSQEAIPFAPAIQNHAAVSKRQIPPLVLTVWLERTERPNM
jgi:hypothetical protein